MLNQIDYDLYLKEIAQTNNCFKKIFVGRETFPPVFFFGDTVGAVAATVGVNPSAEEFSPARKWTGFDDTGKLVDRCRRYFEKPSGVPAHPWFEPWETFLRQIGLSYYKVPRAVHLDISPRATRSMGSIQSSEQIELFLSMCQTDLKYMINHLRVYPSIKHLYVAGSITKKYYIIEFLKKHAPLYGYSLKSVFPFERGGSGKIGLYKFDLGDKVSRFLFFCSTSPSSRVGKNTICEKATLLKTTYPQFIP